MPTAPQNAGYTGASQDFNTSDLNDLASSLASEYSQTTGGTGTGTDRFTRSTTGTATETGSGASVTGAATASSPTTFATSASAGASDSGSPTNGSPSNTASNAASSTTGAVTVSEKSSCNSISCSSALQAAVAVPVVIGVIAAILLFFFCARRRRRRAAGGTVSEKRPPKAGKKWTRHLRAFSFDAELLMGGRFSSSNSLRSRDPSVRSSAGSPTRNGSHSAEPSLHSIEEVAPPYRDAITHVTPPSPVRAVPGAAAIAADPIPRPLSTATAPPPYRSVVAGASPEPASPSQARNPFADSTPVSPVEESPFNDPPGAALGTSLSRGSSMYRSVMTDEDAATPTASEAGSIREAVVGRRVSLRNAGSTSGGSS